ncbi:MULTISPECIES: TRAP transporter large permease [Mameliella]|uniref:TRAP dicarboxylate transporter, DctM subunit n=1 Tax=Mameliella alba TaxID=561184 RepID=A0A0B3S5C2_9RHOB|nr:MULTISPECIES: TRAP transporter large permease subunit [Mameliella]MBV6636698.1 TRAP transporter large permease subunit [Mameliella sp.]MCR9273772.1 TRAP transporter large permease subunit [Paracoccaceae bacterium]ODM47575.1 C4-dicarboxylate ABC transporter permease [Ruegeria sp. PBVC088]KHQ51881.1 TRAP dicarboxylate transporter, DctM subunit [Mameliella alba]MBY6122386.1 TRAP transporter large permease subunit [Mameliella alba]
MVDIGTLSLILLLAMFALLAIGMPLGFASAFLAVVTLVLKFDVDILFRTWGQGPLSVLGQAVYRQMTNYVLISVPLFIFMAALLERSGIARDMYSSLNVWLSRVRGGIAIVTSVMAVIMAAMSGIIGGEVVLLGLIALPQMLRLGYNQNLAIGTICASGSLGTMIPPSIVLIFYGLVTETSIKALFTASFLPGFMLASFFIIYIIVTTQLSPEKAPLPPEDPDAPKGGEKGLMFLGFLSRFGIWITGVLILRALFFTVTGVNEVVEGVDPILLGMVSDIPWLAGALVIFALIVFFVVGRERTAAGWEMGKGLIAPIVVIGVVLGSIYGGITGITEAAGMGAVAVFVIGLIRREMTWDIVYDSLMRTLKSTGTIIWVTIGAAALAAAYTLAGGPQYVANMIVGADMPTMSVILVMMLIFLIMGMFMDWVGIVLLVMPVFLPIVVRLPAEEIGWFAHVDARYVPIWFGVVFCMNMQVSFLSPPFGPAAFYLKSVAPAHISLTDIFRGFLPFIALQLCALAVLLAWPPIVTIFL